MINIGFHLSVAGAFSAAAEEAQKEGYGCFQVFVTSSRSWKSKGMDDGDAERFKEINRMSGARPFAHMPYICNPSAPEKATFEKGVGLMVENIERCRRLGIAGAVAHMGSHKGKGIKYGIERVSEALGMALDAADGAGILLENGAGYRNSVGSKFEEIGEIMDTVSSRRVGLCMDTCHAFAAGYEMRGDGAVKALAGEIREYIGMQKLSLVHLNDSKYQIGSGLDRHWHIGEGEIGMEGFASLFRNRDFSKGNFVLETPYKKEGDDRRNLKAAMEAIALAKGR